MVAFVRKTEILAGSIEARLPAERNPCVVPAPIFAGAWAYFTVYVPGLSARRMEPTSQPIPAAQAAAAARADARPVAAQ